MQTSFGYIERGVLFVFFENEAQIDVINRTRLEVYKNFNLMCEGLILIWHIFSV